ncbi:OprO/OprP family phosphate-selective porin [Sphingopyxis flava]|uniref:Phosphate-selective porin OprO and OprP n=1 Tax=Sphingopyxis flava TaxID=1507287 RepID=A0A1T4ZUB1_9SPHN|nr:porin [Sphingopyxis flava]SKB26099.1 phosphate-selective porin OprO and OprP [Sphingopyxis flava]
MRKRLTATMLATTMLAMPAGARAQVMSAEEAAALRGELASLRAKVDAIEARLGSAPLAPAGASASPSDPAPQEANKSAAETVWNGAPEIKTAHGWSFKPRGRMQLDVASVEAPAGTGIRGGPATEFRRVYLGVDGKIPGGFSYRVEADFANEAVELTDVYLTYGTGALSVTAGQIKPFWSLDEMTSDLFTSAMERAAFSQAFGFERRVGLSAQYKGAALLLQGGVFGANARELFDDDNRSVSVDARAVWMPKTKDVQWHLGASFHSRDLGDPAATLRYRARPFAHTTDVRLIDTGDIEAKGERGMGLEAAVIAGPFHAAGEAYWQTVRRRAAADPTWFGGYAEVGAVLTPGDRRGYKEGAFDRLKPLRPITEGGIGAVEMNARYDYLDLNDKGVAGGRQQAMLLSLVWAPIDFVRLTANFGKLWINDSPIAAATGERDYSAETFGLRTQIDF